MSSTSASTFRIEQLRERRNKAKGGGKQSKILDKVVDSVAGKGGEYGGSQSSGGRDSTTTSSKEYATSSKESASVDSFDEVIGSGYDRRNSRPSSGRPSSGRPSTPPINNPDAARAKNSVPGVPMNSTSTRQDVLGTRRKNSFNASEKRSSTNSNSANSTTGSRRGSFSKTQPATGTTSETKAGKSREVAAAPGSLGATARPRMVGVGKTKIPIAEPLQNETVERTKTLVDRYDKDPMFDYDYDPSREGHGSPNDPSNSSSTRCDSRTSGRSSGGSKLDSKRLSGKQDATDQQIDSFLQWIDDEEDEDDAMLLGHMSAKKTPATLKSSPVDSVGCNVRAKTIAEGRRQGEDIVKRASQNEAIKPITGGFAIESPIDVTVKKNASDVKKPADLLSSSSSPMTASAVPRTNEGESSTTASTYAEKTSVSTHEEKDSAADQTSETTDQPVGLSVDAIEVEDALVDDVKESVNDGVRTSVETGNTTKQDVKDDIANGSSTNSKSPVVQTSPNLKTEDGIVPVEFDFSEDILAKKHTGTRNKSPIYVASPAKEPTDAPVGSPLVERKPIRPAIARGKIRPTPGRAEHVKPTDSTQDTKDGPLKKKANKGGKEEKTEGKGESRTSSSKGSQSKGEQTSSKGGTKSGGKSGKSQGKSTSSSKVVVKTNRGPFSLSKESKAINSRYRPYVKNLKQFGLSVSFSIDLNEEIDGDSGQNTPAVLPVVDFVVKTFPESYPVQPDSIRIRNGSDQKDISHLLSKIAWAKFQSRDENLEEGCYLACSIDVLCAILLGEAAMLCSSLDSDSYSAVSNTDADLANAAEIASILGDAGLEPIMEEEESDALMDAAFELRKILLWKANNEGERTESDFDSDATAPSTMITAEDTLTRLQERGATISKNTFSVLASPKDGTSMKSRKDANASVTSSRDSVSDGLLSGMGGLGDKTGTVLSGTPEGETEKRNQLAASKKRQQKENAKKKEEAKLDKLSRQLSDFRSIDDLDLSEFSMDDLRYVMMTSDKPAGEERYVPRKRYF